MMPLRGWPSSEMSKLKARVRGISRRRAVSAFYIGRTVDLDATYHRHGCDDILPVYETASIGHASEVETELIRTFISHPKCDNDATHAGGGVSEEYVYYVYVAVWY